MFLFFYLKIKSDLRIYATAKKWKENDKNDIFN